jgi:competence protein ComEC
MRSAIIAFAIGIGWLQQQAELPTTDSMFVVGVVWCGVALALVLSGRGSRSSHWRSVGVIVLAAALGFLWAATRAHIRLADHLPTAHERREIEITGVVSGLPQTLERGMRFEFDVEQSSLTIPKHISLAWYQSWNLLDENGSAAIPVHVGERWRFIVRLKQPHGNMNPHGFDYEGWLLERGIRATGYVRPRTAVWLDAEVDRPAYRIERLRENIRSRLYALLPEAESPYVGILVALVVGDQSAIEPALWLRFAQTGVTHLMSISGLHITMLAGLGYLLSGWLWRRSTRLLLFMSAQSVAAVGGMIAALFYCLLAGFAVPAQRTLVMLSIVAVARLSGREMASSRVLALALLFVVLLDPWAVLAAGFWLSFGAVSLLFLIGSGRIGSAHWLLEWLRAQWAVTLGMLPALLALFQQFSLVSPLANAIAIPVVSFVITPLAMFGGLPFMSPLLSLAHAVTSWMMIFLDALARIPGAVWQQAAPPAWAVVLALLGGGWLLLPRGMPARWLGVLAFLPLLSFAPLRPDEGAARITVLDVGQGLAVHVQTARHDLLFDTGPAFSADADSGNRIIVPYLRAEGVRRLDTLVISHADRDHSGGAESVLAAIPVSLIRASLPFEHALSMQPVRQLPCVAGEAWEWDGVHFKMLHPPADFDAKKTNNVSCVLRVSAGGHGFLLTSDIESPAELMLLDRYRSSLKTDIMTAPHHGSRTSSSAGFLDAVQARDVIFPAGYLNPHGHPAAEVVERYIAREVRLHRTDLDGAVRVDMSASGVAWSHERAARRRYWHARTGHEPLRQ